MSTTQQQQRQRLEPGVVVVPNPGARIKGAGPFDRLVVTSVSKRGNLTLAWLGGGGTWAGVRPTDVSPVDAC